jgi:hypothetical protein
LPSPSSTNWRCRNICGSVSRPATDTALALIWAMEFTYPSFVVDLATPIPSKRRSSLVLT